MPKSKDEKIKIVAELASDMQAARGAVVLEFNKLETKLERELRATLKLQGMRYRVVKRTLLTRALRKLGTRVPGVLGEVKGGLALTTGGDEVGAAKAVGEFMANHKDTLSFLGGFFRTAQGVEVLDAKGVSALATLPSAHELRGTVVRTLAEPMRGLVSVLHGSVSQFVSVVRAIKDSHAQ